MSLIGMWDTKELEKFIDELKQLTKEEIEQFHINTIKEIAAKTLAKMIFQTPVGDYPSETGKKGGTLRRGWTGGKEVVDENGNIDKEALLDYVMNDIEVIKKGNVYQIIIINPVKYASYVEYGHRQNVGQFVPVIGKRLKKPFVAGKYMMTDSIDEMQKELPALLEKKLKDFVEEYFK